MKNHRNITDYCLEVNNFPDPIIDSKELQRHFENLNFKIHEAFLTRIYFNCLFDYK